MSKKPSPPAPPRPLVMPWERHGRPALTGAWWARALRLDERRPAEVPEAAPAADGTADESGAGGGDAAVVAGIRLRKWREGFAGLDAGTFDRQAAAYGCTPRQVAWLLAEPPEALARRVAKPAWADDVERVAAIAAREEDPPGAGGVEPSGRERDVPTPGGGWQRGFALILDPFVREAVRVFDARTGNVDGTEGDAAPGRAGQGEASQGEVRQGEASQGEAAAVRRAVRAEAARRLVPIACRVLVLELHVLRVTGRLEGATPGDRFWSFVRHYRHPAAFAGLLDEYAVLARLLATTAGQVGEAHAEFLRRLDRDRPELVRCLFGGVDPGPLTTVDLARGDTHAGGRSVGIATFASGARAVYKPRPTAAHRHFNDVVAWYNRRVPEAARLRRLALVERADHGWAEFAEAGECADGDAARRHFERQGALLAILHALGGVDVHFENLVAAGDQPVPVDLETLFCADLPRTFGSPTLDGDPAAAAYRASVGRVGLLPSVIIAADGQAFDAGGMGGDHEAVLPYRVVDWVAAGTDMMRLERVRPVLAGGRNRPRLGGRDLDAVGYAGPLLAGYRAAYGVLAAGADELPGPEGPLAGFSDADVRIITRPTHEYATLLAESTDPGLLRDALDREQVFGVLWARGAADPVRARVARHEAADLWRGDVPLFTARAGSRDVRTADGTPVVGLLPESGVDRVRWTLAALGERHLAEQEWIIAAQLATRTTGAEPRGTDASPESPRRSAPTSGTPLPVDPSAVPQASAPPSALADRALSAARAIAERLAASAYTDAGRLGWLGLDLWQEQRWSVRPLGTDLYNGSAGVALFLAQLAHVTGEQRYADLARGALEPVLGHVRETLDEPAALVGAFTGLTGETYALDSCAALLGDAAVAALVAPALRRAAEQIAPGVAYDVVGGAAGALAVAEALTARHGAAARELAERCAALLCGAAAPAGAGVAWPGRTAHPLLGFSHGAAGIGWALLCHARRTGDDAAVATGLGAFAYERGAYEQSGRSAGAGGSAGLAADWPDHRGPDANGQRTWCHGAPGIALARAAVLRDAPAHWDRAANALDLRRALDGTRTAAAHPNESLCHGQLGNLEAFAAAADCGTPDARRAWQARAAAVVARIERDGPVCGTPGGIATPGLMTGLAGVGHGLLRIAAPHQVAPVLLLAPPPHV